MIKKFKQIVEDAKLGNLIRRITNSGERVIFKVSPVPVHGPDPAEKIAITIADKSGSKIETLLDSAQGLCKFYYPAVSEDSDDRIRHSDIKDVRMITMEEAAASAGVTVATIERLVEEGKLTTYLCQPHGHREPVTYVDLTDLELMLMNEAWEYGII